MNKIIDEKALTYVIKADTSMLNEYGEMTIQAYQRMIVTVIEQHLEKIELDIPHLMRDLGISWVLMSVCIDVKDSIKAGEELYANTWNTWHKKAIYRRDVRVCRKDGTTVINAATFSTLFDVAKRRICMDQGIISQIGLPDGAELLHGESRLRIDVNELPEVDTVKVRPSWIDALGHMNNMRYAELVYDAITDKKRKELNRLSRVEMYFTGETRKGESMVLRMDENAEYTIVAGVRSSDAKTAFVSKLMFEK